MESVRKREHEWHAKNGSDFYFHRALRKYGLENFKWKVLGTADTIEELNLLEQEYIASLNTMVPNGYNLTNGGDGTSGYKHSEKTRQLIKENHADMSGKKNPFYNKKHTFETRQIISEINTGRNKGEKHPMFGKKRSLKTRQMISDVRQGLGLFGFTGATYVVKRIPPWFRVWNSRINYKGKMKSLGYFEDPLSCEIVYRLVRGEIKRVYEEEVNEHKNRC